MDNFDKILEGVIDDEDISFYAVDKKTKTVQLMLGNWNLELRNDGSYEIA